MVDLLTGKTANDSLQAQKDAVAASQRTTLAQLAAQQGDLDQEAAGVSKKNRGRRLLTFVAATPGDATLG